jgi:lipopolysaccharide transport system ATP-binding protein
MSTIVRLCNSALLLRHGELQFNGRVSEATKLYLSEGGRQPAEVQWRDSALAPGDEFCRLRSVRVTNLEGAVSARITINDPVFIEVEYEQLKEGLAKPLTTSVHLVNDAGITVFASNDFDNLKWYETARRAGLVHARCEIPGHFLAEGTYTVLAAVCSYDPNVVHAIERDAIQFQAVENCEVVGARSEYAGDWPGVTRPKLTWEVKFAT